MNIQCDNGTTPRARAKKDESNCIFYLLCAVVLVPLLTLVCVLSLELKMRNAKVERGVGVDTRFRCAFVNETLSADTNSTEICEKSDNALPHCFAVYQHNMKTRNHKVRETTHPPKIFRTSIWFLGSRFKKARDSTLYNYKIIYVYMYTA